MNAENIIWATFETKRAAANFAVIPATVDEPGHVKVRVIERGGEYCGARLDRRDLSQMIQVLRGMREFADFRNEGDVTFRHVIEPIRGYRLAFSSDGRARASITFDCDDALALMLALEGAFTKLVFGI